MRARSHLALAFAGLEALSGCGAPPSRPVSTPSPIASAQAPSANAVTPPPVGAAARASAEGLVLRARMASIMKVRDLLPPFAVTEAANEVGDQLGVERGILTEPDVLKKLGIDPMGTITFESFQLDEQGGSTAAKLHGLKTDLDDEDLATSLLHEHGRMAKVGWFLTRMRVPVKGDTFEDLVERGLTRRGGHRSEMGVGDVAYTLGRSVWHLKKDGDSMLLELALSERTTEPRDVRDALGALAAWSPTSAPPLLAGEDFVARMRPSAVTTGGFFLATQRIAEIVDRGSDPQATQRMLARTYREARALDGMDAPTDRPRYESIVVTVSGDRATLTSTFADGAEPPRTGDWTESGADFNVDGSMVTFSVNGPLLYAWTMIPAREGVNPYFAHDIGRAAERSDFPAPLLFVGDAPFLLARGAMEEAQPIGHATLPFLRKWDRLGEVVVPRPGSHPEGVFVGILPANATEENAACALSREDKGCPAKERLRPDVTIKRANMVVMRKKLGGRWVVMASRDEAILKGLPIHVVVGTRSPFNASIDPKATASALGLPGNFMLPPYHSTLGLAGDEKSFTFTLKP